MSEQNKSDQIAKIEDLMTLVVSAMTHIEAVNRSMNAAIEAVIPDEVKQQIADIKAEFQQQLDSAQAFIDQATPQIKEGVIALGETVTVEGLQAVYTDGKTTWDSKFLEGMATQVPAISKAKKVGAPSVSIKRHK